MDALNAACQSGDVRSATKLVSGPADPGRLLRNGLAVVAFAAFEDFFEGRSGEVLAHIDHQRIPFTGLPDSLQEAATSGVLEVLRHKFDRRLAPDLRTRISGYQTGAASVASTAQSVYMISPHTFSLSRSNISHEQVKTCLSAMGCKDPWRQMTLLGARCGYGVPDLNSVFRQITAARHEAAHGAASDTSISFLDNLATELTVVALTWDALICRSVGLLMDNYRAGPGQICDINQADVAIHFLEATSAGYADMQEGKQRATKRYPSRDSAMADMSARYAHKSVLLVERDGQKLPTSWVTLAFP